MSSTSSSTVSEDVSKFLKERTVVRYNGGKARRLFSDGEYERRLSELRWVLCYTKDTRTVIIPHCLGS